MNVLAVGRDEIWAPTPPLWGRWGYKGVTLDKAIGNDAEILDYYRDPCGHVQVREHATEDA